MSLQQIKSEICQLLNLATISASEAKQLPEASNITTNWSKTETWEQLLDNIKQYQSTLESTVPNVVVNNVESVVELNMDFSFNMDLGIGLGLNNLPTYPSIEDKEVKTLNLKGRSKRAVNYADITDSGYKVIILYLHLPSINYIISGVYESIQDTEPLITNKVREIKEKTYTALERYELLLKKQKGSKQEKQRLLSDKKEVLETEQKDAIVALNKHSNVEDVYLTTTIGAEISKINFKDIAVRRQRRILEDSGMAFNISQDLQQIYKKLWRELEKVNIDVETNERLLQQQNGDSFNNKLFTYIFNNLPNKVKQQFRTQFNFNAPLNIIENISHIKQHGNETILNLSNQKLDFNLTRQDSNEFDKYLAFIESIEAKNKDNRSEYEAYVLDVHKAGCKFAMEHLLENYTVDISILSLKQWIGICLDHLGVKAAKGKRRIDVYADSIFSLEVRKNPVAVIAHLLFENIYNSREILVKSEFNAQTVSTLDTYAVVRTVEEFKNTFEEYLLADLRYIDNRLFTDSGNTELSKKCQVWFHKHLESNRRIIKNWLATNSDYKPTILCDDFRKLYRLIKKTTDYKPSNLNIADDILKISYRPINTLEVMALPATLTSHFESKEKVGDKYRKSPVAQGKMRVSAINDRSLNNLLPNIPLYCRQKLGDIIVVLKASPVENRLIDIVWCDKSELDKGGKQLTFNPIGSLSSKNINGKHILLCKLVPKFVTLANKHKCGNDTTALYYILAALDNWGLKDNHPVAYNPNRHIEIAEIKEAEKIFTSTDNEKLEKYLADKYALGKNLKFIPIWSELIANYFNLGFNPVKVDGRNYIEVIDKREIRNINNFKRTYPQAKQSATNPISRLVYQVSHNSTLDKVDDREEIVSKKVEINAREYYNLLGKNNLSEADEVVLKDGRILRKVKQVHNYTNRIVEEIVTGTDNKGRLLKEKRVVEEKREKVDAGYKYYLVTERRINTWHY